MLRALAITTTLASAAVAAAWQPALPSRAEVAKLVARLGSEDFAEREAATRRLEGLGAAAVEELRAAVRSDNPEVVRRASDLLRKAERTLANEKALAPTLVELDAKDRPLDDVLADLSKQAKCEVVLGGAKPADLAAKRVSVTTDGKVPFWSAVLAVCDAGELQVAVAGGFAAPGYSVASPLPPAGQYRRVTNPNLAVVLEARDKSRRPAAVRGAVLVEAVPFPAGAKLDQPTALLQVWPEPRLQWERTTGLKVSRATAADGSRLVADPVPVPDLQGEVIGRRGDGVIIVRNPDGTARVVRDTGEFLLPGGFRPNPRQAVVRLKAGEKPATAAKELAVSVLGSARTRVEPLAIATGLELNKTVSASGAADVKLSITYQKGPDGKYRAEVELTYDARAVRPAGASDDLSGARVGGVAGNNTVHGVRVADADGKPYTLGLEGGANQFDPNGRRVVMKLQIGLHGAKDGLGPPASATFWGTYSRPVEVAVSLPDVPLAGGK